MAQRIRVRYAKRDRLRFSSHRDFARAFERALRRAGVPMAYSAGFSPHPKISYLGAAPTGVASEAEYLEIGLAEQVDPGRLRAVLDAALPAGLDVLECVPAGPGTLAERVDAARWEITLPGAAPAVVSQALAAFLAADQVAVERRTKDGHRTVDVRAAVVRGGVTDGGAAARVITDSRTAAGGGPEDKSVTGRSAAGGAAGRSAGGSGAGGGVAGGNTHYSEVDEVIGASVPDSPQPCAILEVVVLQAVPAVRPDDVLAALRAVAGFEPPFAPRAKRLAQGLLDDAGGLADPLGPDRTAALPARQGGTAPAEQSPA